MTILENSKTLMYDFYYNFLKKKYGDRCELIYADTDSLLLDVQTKDIYADMAAHANLFYTSDYPKSHLLHSVKSEKVLGKMKDEMGGAPIAEVVCLRPKKYSILRAHDVVQKKAKGIKKSVVKEYIKHEHYKETLFRRTEETNTAWTSCGAKNTKSTG